MKYIATFFKVTDTEIIATGKVETYLQPTMDQAISAAIYTHQLHDGTATRSRAYGVISCPKCGQIAITTAREGSQ